MKADSFQRFVDIVVTLDFNIVSDLVSHTQILYTNLPPTKLDTLMRARTSTKPSKWNSTSKRQEFVESKAKINNAFLKECLLQYRGNSFRKFPLEGFLKVLGLPILFPRGRGDRTVRLTYDDIVPTMKKLLAPYCEIKASWHYGKRSYMVKPKLTFDQIQSIQVLERDAKVYAKHIEKLYGPRFVEVQKRHLDGDKRATQFLNSLPHAVKAFEEHGLAPKGVDVLQYLLATASFPENQGRYYTAWHTLPKGKREKIWPNIIDLKSATPALFLKICEEISGEKSPTLAEYQSGADIYAVMGLESREANKKAFLRALNKADESLALFQEKCVQRALECVSEDVDFQSYSKKNQALFRKNYFWMGKDGDWSQVDRMEIVQYILQVLVNGRETEIVNELQLCIPGSIGLHDGVETSSIPSDSSQLDIQNILDNHCLSGTVEVTNN